MRAASVSLKWAKKPKEGEQVTKYKSREGKKRDGMFSERTYGCISSTRQASRAELPSGNIIQAINVMCHFLAATFSKSKKKQEK